jgi:pantetheine-phosphate adenylyltransferase
VRRYGRVALGGTFDRFHAGHEALLRTAFQIGRTVAIGLTSEAFLAGHPKPRGRAIASQASRRRALVRWLRRHYGSARWTVVPIDDAFGGAAEGDLDALVVSADSVVGGRALNRERVRRGRPPVPLVVVPLVLAEDLEPLRSRRIRAEEVDRQGHCRGPLAVGLIVADEGDRPASVRGLRRALPGARVGRPRRRLPRGSGSSASAVGRLAGRARGTRALGVAVGRRGPTGWLVSVQGRHARLDPRRIVGSSPRDLEEGLARLLRPSPSGGRRR